MRLSSIAALNLDSALLSDPARIAAENSGPHLAVFDDFYEDPDQVRELALDCQYFQYSPPLASQVGADIAQRFSEQDPRWFSTSLQRYHGQLVNTPETGFRYNGDSVKRRLEALIGERIRPDTWDTLGDGWNGAFHLQLPGRSRKGWSIHHHYKKGDVYPRGWSGVVYLHPDPPDGTGTTIWRDLNTGKCIAGEGAVFDRDTSRFEQVLEIENRFNRLVLFRENVLHRAEPAFGDSRETGRLTQTFFFLSESIGNINAMSRLEFCRTT